MGNANARNFFLSTKNRGASDLLSGCFKAEVRCIKP